MPNEREPRVSNSPTDAELELERIARRIACTATNLTNILAALKDVRDRTAKRCAEIATQREHGLAPGHWLSGYECGRDAAGREIKKEFNL